MENLNMGMIDADLRTAIVGSGLTAYAIAKRADTSPDVVSRFVTGERDVRLGTAARIAAALGLELKLPGRSSPTKKKKKKPAAK
jgi:transcriptional regulator with XRE-family HTH domain